MPMRTVNDTRKGEEPSELSCARYWTVQRGTQLQSVWHPRTVLSWDTASVDGDDLNEMIVVTRGKFPFTNGHAGRGFVPEQKSSAKIGWSRAKKGAQVRPCSQTSIALPRKPVRTIRYGRRRTGG
jgi:hypothetical protein